MTETLIADPMDVPPELQGLAEPLGPVGTRVAGNALIVELKQKQRGTWSYALRMKGVFITGTFRKRLGFRDGDTVVVTGTIERYEKSGHYIDAQLADCSAGKLVESLERRQERLDLERDQAFQALIEQDRGLKLDREWATKLLNGRATGLAEWNRRRAAGEEPPDLSGANIYESNFEAADFSRTNLSTVVLKGSRLDRVNAERAILRQANLNHCESRAGKFSKAQMQDAELEFASFVECDFSDATLEGARLSNSSLKASMFSGCILNRVLAPESNWADAKLTGATASQADFEEASFGKADLSGADLSDVKAPRAKFKRAILVATKLRNANLSEADFTNADLRGADLTGADVTDASFEGVRVDDATILESDLRARLRRPE